MAVISGIMRGIEIGRKIYRVQRQFDRRIQGVSPANQFINRYAPPGYRPVLKKAYRYAEAGLAGKLIYDLISQGMKSEDNGIQKKQRSTTKYRETRTDVYKSRSGQRGRNKFYPCPSRRRKF